MGSFYGGGGIGGSGTSDYNDMTNTPIQNLKGSSQSRFVNLAGVPAGHYNLEGYYKLDSLTPLQNATEPIDLIVSTDSQTNRTVIQFTSIENEVPYLNLISYENGLVYKQNKIAIGSGGQAEIFWGDII